MNKIIIIIFISILPNLIFSQTNNANAGISNQDTDPIGDKKKDVYDIKKHRYADSMEVYKSFEIYGDTSILDTSLSIKTYYNLNQLRRDLFGLQPLSNIGQGFSILTYQKNNFSATPNLGFYVRDLYYQKSENVKYHDVRSPITQLDYKTTFTEGNILNAFFTANITPDLNFSVSYFGLRSIGTYLGNYISQNHFLSTLNYKSTFYTVFMHYINQRVFADENGGIKDVDNFTSGEEQYLTRANINTNLSSETNSFLKGQIFFLNHSFHLINNKPITFSINHQFSYENKYFSYEDSYDQDSKNFYDSELVDDNLSSNDSTFYEKIDNDFGGVINLFGSKFSSHYNISKVDYHYKGIKLYDDILVENLPVSTNHFLKFHIYNDSLLPFTTIKIKYTKGIFGDYKNSDFTYLNILFSKDNFSINTYFQNINKYPDFTFFVFQSNYKNFNWQNNISELENRKDFNLSFSYKNYKISFFLHSIKNYYYFDQDRLPQIYDENINITSLNLSLPLKFWRFGLENDFIYQKVLEGQQVYRLPNWITRNTLYFEQPVIFYSGKKTVLFFQTGITLNMFASYRANGYNPLYSDYHLQDEIEVGGYPMLDFFINAKIRTMKIFFIAQHFNNLSIFNPSYNYFSAPYQPYLDFTIRFGIIWNFFS